MADNPWIEWQGGECPVADDTMVDAKLRGGDIRDNYAAGVLDWSRRQEPKWHIIAYRILP